MSETTNQGLLDRYDDGGLEWFRAIAGAMLKLKEENPGREYKERHEVNVLLHELLKRLNEENSHQDHLTPIGVGNITGILWDGKSGNTITIDEMLECLWRILVETIPEKAKRAAAEAELAVKEAELAVLRGEQLLGLHACLREL